MNFKAIVKLLESSKPPGDIQTRTIAVDGPGGAGKTVLAERIGLALNAQVIHVDDFFDPVVRSDWWKRFMNEVLEPLANNRKGNYQRYDWDTKSLAEWHIVETADFVIVEGVQSSRKNLRAKLTFTIWVETPRHIRLKRGIERDGEEARAEWDVWMAQEDAYINDEHPALFADLVVDGTDSSILE